MVPRFQRVESERPSGRARSARRPTRGRLVVPVELLTLALLALLALGGCAPRITTRHVVPPAFPIVFGGPLVVTGESSAFDSAAAEALASGLVAVGLPVRYQPGATVVEGARVLTLRLGFEARWDRQWTTRPETICGPFGCQVRQSNVLVDVPVLLAELHATVRGPDGATLAGHTVRDRLTRTDGADVRAELLRRLVVQLARDVSPRRLQVRFRWPRTGDDAIDSLAPRAERGEFAALVEPLRQAIEVHGASLAASRRARALVALAWSLRLSAGTAEAPVDALDEALRCLDEAAALEPNVVPEGLRDAVVHERALHAGLRAPVAAPLGELPVPDAYRRPASP